MLFASFHAFLFLLTRPLRDVTFLLRAFAAISAFLLTRPLRDVTEITGMKIGYDAISTHTPLAGRDHLSSPFPSGFWPISTHTPLAGRDQTISLSHHSLKYFYSHAPCGT